MLTPRIYSPFVQSVGGTLFTLILVAGAMQLLADPEPADLPHLVPYSGTIEQDGVRINGEVDLRLTLYPSADGGAQVWREVHEGVSVFNGEFSVLLGDGDSGDTLDDAVWQRGPLFLAVAVRPDGGASWMALNSRQRVGPAPYARLSAGLSGNDNIVLGTPGGAVPPRHGSSSTRGFKVFAGSDNAFFGLVSRSGDPENPNDNEYDTHLYFGDDLDDSLVMASQDFGPVLTLSGAGQATFHGSVLTSAATGALAVSTSHVFRDTGDQWLRLRTGATSDTYADLAVGEMYIAETNFMYHGTHINGGTTSKIGYHPPFVLSVAPRHSVQIPQSIIQTHCQDNGGCRLTIINRDISGTGRHSSRSMQLISTQHGWRLDHSTHDAAWGVDGNGSHESTIQWYCRFGDANYPTTSHDGDVSMWGGSEHDTVGCDFRIDD